MEHILEIGIAVGINEVASFVAISANDVAQTGGNVVGSFFDHLKVKSVSKDVGNPAAGGAGGGQIGGQLDQTRLSGLVDVVVGPQAGEIGIAQGAQHHGGDFLLGNQLVGGELAVANADHQLVIQGAVDVAFGPVTFGHVGESGFLQAVVGVSIINIKQVAGQFGKFGTGDILGFGKGAIGIALENAKGGQLIDGLGIGGVLGDVSITNSLGIGGHSGGSQGEDHSDGQEHG